MKCPSYSTKTILAFSLFGLSLLCFQSQSVFTARNSRPLPEGKLSVSPASLTLEIGKPGVHLEIKLGEKNITEIENFASNLTADLTSSDANQLDFNSTEQTLSLKSNVKYITATKTIRLKLKFKQEGQPDVISNQVTVTIKPNLKSIAVKIGNQPVQANETVEITAGQEKLISVVAEDTAGNAISESAFSLKSRNETIAKVTNLKLSVADLDRDADTQIDVSISPQMNSFFSFKLEVLAKVSTIEFIDQPGQLYEGDKRDFRIALKSKSGAQLQITDNRKVNAKLAAPEQSSLIKLSQEGTMLSVEAPYWPKEDNPPAKKSVTINFEVAQTDVTESIKNKLHLDILRRDGYITFLPPIVEPLLPRGKVTTTAEVRDLSGNPKETAVLFRLENKSDEKWVILAQQGKQLTVYWRDPAQSELIVRDGSGNAANLQRPAQVVISAVAHLTNQPITSSITVRLAEVSKFVPLKVKLNVMDERMASDLYGSVTAKENYVLTVRLFNNLRDDKTKQYDGSSILAYSASVEIAVGLQKRFNSKLKTDLPVIWDKKTSEALAKERKDKLDGITKTQVKDDYGELERFRDEIEKIAIKLRQKEEIALSDQRRLQDLLYEKQTNTDPVFEAELRKADRIARDSRREADLAMDELNGLKVQILRMGDSRADLYKLLAEMTDPDIPVDDDKWRPVRRNDLRRIANTYEDKSRPSRKLMLPDQDGDEPICIGVITYRPYTFEMVVNTVDRRDERSPRAIVFKILSGFGTAASVATAIPGLTDANNASSGLSNFQIFLDKFPNLLIPAAEKLFPNLKETHRQNIVSQAMKPIEEIPFGSDITRILFVPKKEMHGLVPGHDVRISDVCPFYFNIEVAVVQKGGFVQQGSISQ